MSEQTVKAALAPQELVERALAAAQSGDCIAIADEGSAANLRWAANSLTTNGVARSRQLTIIAISRRGDEARVGVVSRAGVRADQVPDLVAEAEHAATEATPAEDAQPLLTQSEVPTSHAGRWDDEPDATQIGVFARFAEDLGHAFATAASADRKLYGFAEHQLTSTFVGTSTGLRLRHDQPAGRLELNAKSADMTKSAWAGTSTREFAEVDVAGLEADLGRRLRWAERSVELPAGRYETLLPPTAMADLMIYMYWSAGAKDALDGRTVFSKPGGGTKIGEQLASLPVSLSSDPAAPGLEDRKSVV